MKLYLAAEAKNKARSLNNKRYKNDLDLLIEEVMYIIMTTSRDGGYHILHTTSQLEEAAHTTFVSILRELGYIVTRENNEYRISWD